MPDLHKLADAISTKSPNIRAFAEAVADVLQPTPPPSSLWNWDATKAARLPVQDRAAFAAAAVSSKGAVFSASVAVSDPPAGTTAYPITATGVTANVPLAPGVQPGGSVDRHLVVRFNGWNYGMHAFDPVAHKSGGLGVVYPGTATEARPGGSNAARFDLSGGLITAYDVAAHRLHTLVLSLPLNAVLGTSSVYPADTDYNDPRCPYGQWFRLDPTATPPLYGDPLTAYVDACLRACGAMVRDTGSGMTFYGEDYVNAGGNVVAYARADVALLLQGVSYPIGCYLAGIPWSELQALAPPTP